jgi:hypothetical protein
MKPFATGQVDLRARLHELGERRDASELGEAERPWDVDPDRGARLVEALLVEEREDGVLSRREHDERFGEPLALRGDEPGEWSFGGYSSVPGFFRRQATSRSTSSSGRDSGGWTSFSKTCREYKPRD